MGIEKYIPPRLYKYYSASCIEHVISDNTIRWAVPCEENDPFEAMASGWDLEAVKERFPDFRAEQTTILDGFFDANATQKRISHVAAFVSFTEDEKNILMWAHYAENHTGVCLEFDTKYIQRIDCLRRVKYAKPDEDRDRLSLPHGNQSGNSQEYQERARTFLSKKGCEWYYEKEWRLIVPPMADIIGYKKVGDRHILTSDIPQGAITKIIFGYRVPVSTRLAWAKGIRKNHCKCQFAEVVPGDKKYELKVEQLDMDVIERPLSKVSRDCLRRLQ